MNLRKKIAYLISILGVLLIVFASYWSLYKYPDPSQFFAFAGLGFGFILIGFFAIELDNQAKKLEKFEKEIEYFEDKLLEKYPSLTKGRKK